jgi:hypothetical protein
MRDDMYRRYRKCTVKSTGEEGLVVSGFLVRLISEPALTFYQASCHRCQSRD